MTSLHDLRSERAALERKRDELLGQRSAAFTEHCTATEALAEGTGPAQAVADAKATVSSLDSAIDVIRSRLSAVAAEIAPLEAAVARDRQLRHLHELADRAIAVHSEMLEQRAQAAEQVAALIADVIGSPSGYGGRLRELAQVLADLATLASKLSNNPDSHGALWRLLELSGKDRIHIALRAQLPGLRNPFHRWVRPDDLPDLGTAGLIVDQLAEMLTLRPATEEDLAALGR